MPASLRRWAMALFLSGRSVPASIILVDVGTGPLASAIKVGVQHLRGDGSVLVRRRCHIRRGIIPFTVSTASRFN